MSISWLNFAKGKSSSISLCESSIFLKRRLDKFYSKQRLPYSICTITTSCIGNHPLTLATSSLKILSMTSKPRSSSWSTCPQPFFSIPANLPSGNVLAQYYLNNLVVLHSPWGLRAMLQWKMRYLVFGCHYVRPPVGVAAVLGRNWHRYPQKCTIRQDRLRQPHLEKSICPG